MNPETRAYIQGYAEASAKALPFFDAMVLEWFEQNFPYSERDLRSAKVKPETVMKLVGYIKS